MCPDRTGSKFWFRNTCGKIKSDLYNRFELQYAIRHFFWDTLYVIVSIKYIFLCERTHDTHKSLQQPQSQKHDWPTLVDSPLPVWRSHCLLHCSLCRVTFSLVLVPLIFFLVLKLGGTSENSPSFFNSAKNLLISDIFEWDWWLMSPFQCPAVHSYERWKNASPSFSAVWPGSHTSVECEAGNSMLGSWPVQVLRGPSLLGPSARLMLALLQSTESTIGSGSSAPFKPKTSQVSRSCSTAFQEDNI